jgi:hypothetical protein
MIDCFSKIRHRILQSKDETQVKYLSSTKESHVRRAGVLASVVILFPFSLFPHFF